MPKSRKNKDRKDNLKTYKNKKKTMNQNAELAQSMPPIRNIPHWKGEDNIDVKGFEWEAIINAFNQLQIGLQAIQAVMSRNIVNGTVVMDFEKLDPETLTYKPMVADEKLKYEIEFAEAVKAFKDEREAAGKRPESTSTLVDTDGEPLKAEVTAETPKPEAKVVKGDFAPKQ